MRTGKYLRKLIGCKDEDYTFVFVFYRPLTQEVKEKCKCQKNGLGNGLYGGDFTMSRLKPHMSDEEVNNHLVEYSDLGFDDLPAWLKAELRIRKLPIPRREATNSEKMATVFDAREHRIVNHELTITDYKDKYMHARSLTLID